MLLQVYWKISPYVFDLGWLKLKWYGLCFAFAVLAGYWVLLQQFKRRNLPQHLVALLVQYQFLGGLIGARLGQVLFYDLPYYIAHPAEILFIWHGGLASHGAAVGGFVATYLFFRKYPILSYLQLIDLLAVPAAVIGGLIRIGNLMNSEIVGKPTQLAWAFIFPMYDAQPRHPSQLYEALMLFSIFTLLFWLHQRRTLPIGFLSGLFFTLTFGIRYCLEFFKENAGISQPLNLVLTLLGAGILVWVSICQANKTKVA